MAFIDIITDNTDTMTFTGLQCHLRLVSEVASIPCPEKTDDTQTVSCSTFNLLVAFATWYNYGDLGRILLKNPSVGV